MLRCFELILILLTADVAVCSFLTASEKYAPKSKSPEKVGFDSTDCGLPGESDSLDGFHTLPDLGDARALEAIWNTYFHPHSTEASLGLPENSDSDTPSSGRASPCSDTSVRDNVMTN